jgi:hypothetical protein
MRQKHDKSKGVCIFVHRMIMKKKNEKIEVVPKPAWF